MENEEVEYIDSELSDIDTTKNAVDETDTDESVEDKDTGEEDVEELKKTIETLKHQKEHWKKKADSVKEQKKSVIKPALELSTLDVIALSRANINDEDIQEVVEYAKFKKISIAEALKSSVVKATLLEKEENRKAQEASFTGNSRRGVSKVSDATILDNARKGQLPKENDDEAILRLAKAR